MGKNINYNYYCFNNNLHTPYKMNLNYNTEKKVKPILRFLKKEGLLRSNWLAGESSTFVFGESTWSEKKRNKVKNNYIKRIPEGKVPVFYLDLVEHVIKELKHSKSYFETITQSKIETVAYPYGTAEACTAEVSILASVAGYKFGFTTKRGANSNNDDKLLLKRFDCNDLIGGKNYKV